MINKSTRRSFIKKASAGLSALAIFISLPVKVFCRLLPDKFKGQLPPLPLKKFKESDLHKEHNLAG